MEYQGRILLADDERVFLESTADLLRREGYNCDCVDDGVEAADRLYRGNYELLIADIKMNGNENLELIKNLPGIAEGLPVILVTGYPALKTAIQSINLPVMAYMLKPLEFFELLDHVRVSIKTYRFFRFLHDVRKRVSALERELELIGNATKDMSRNAVMMGPDAFVALTFQNIIGSVADLRRLIADSLAVENQEQEEICHLMNCPRLEELTQSLRHAIDVLEETKKSFKSRELGMLRKKLEEVVDPTHK